MTCDDDIDFNFLNTGCGPLRNFQVSTSTGLTQRFQRRGTNGDQFLTGFLALLEAVTGKLPDQLRDLLIWISGRTTDG